MDDARYSTSKPAGANAKTTKFAYHGNFINITITNDINTNYTTTAINIIR